MCFPFQSSMERCRRRRNEKDKDRMYHRTGKREPGDAGKALPCRHECGKT